jgi:hypothetical protein
VCGGRCRDTTSRVGHCERGRNSGGVIELSSIIALDTPDGATKLHEHIGEEVREVGGVRLMAQQKGA